MFFNGRVVVTVNSFSRASWNMKVLTHSDLEIPFILVIVGNAFIEGIVVTTVRFTINFGAKERWEQVFYC